MLLSQKHFDILYNIYFNTKTGYQSTPTKIYNKVKNKGISLQDVHNFLKQI